MDVGLGVFVGSYAFSVAVGVALKHEDSENCLNCKYGSRLYIPVVGPWLLLPEADGSGGKALTAVMGVL